MSNTKHDETKVQPTSEVIERVGLRRSDVQQPSKTWAFTFDAQREYSCT